MDPVFIFTRDGLSIMFDLDTHVTVLDDNPNFAAIKTAVQNYDWEVAKDLCNPGKAFERVIDDANVSDTVRIDGGVVYWKDTPIHMELTDRMLTMITEGLDVKPLGAFLGNLMTNPSDRAIQELFGFLEKGNMPITEDGCFLAYKRVRENWTDCHSGRICNAICATVSMERESVTDDCNRTCASGLHFCSREYLRSFGGARLVAVKINPRDVVSIPVDYNNAKGRCCKYEVVSEIEEERRLEGSFLDTSDLFEDEDDYDPSDIDVNFNSLSNLSILEIADDDGYVDVTKVPGLDGIDILELASQPVDEIEDPDLVNGTQYWIGDIGPFRSRRDASMAKTMACGIKD